jgi:hypothetical protein
VDPAALRALPVRDLVLTRCQFSKDKRERTVLYLPACRALETCKITGLQKHGAVFPPSVRELELRHIDIGKDGLARFNLGQLPLLCKLRVGVGDDGRAPSPAEEPVCLCPNVTDLDLWVWQQYTASNWALFLLSSLCVPERLVRLKLHVLLRFLPEILPHLHCVQHLVIDLGVSTSRWQTVVQAVTDHLGSMPLLADLTLRGERVHLDLLKMPPELQAQVRVIAADPCGVSLAQDHSVSCSVADVTSTFKY